MKHILSTITLCSQFFLYGCGFVNSSSDIPYQNKDHTEVTTSKLPEIYEIGFICNERNKYFGPYDVGYWLHRDYTFELWYSSGNYFGGSDNFEYRKRENEKKTFEVSDLRITFFFYSESFPSSSPTRLVLNRTNLKLYDGLNNVGSCKITHTKKEFFNILETITQRDSRDYQEILNKRKI